MTAKQLDIIQTYDSEGRTVLTHPEAASITREELIARARAMIPRLRERAAATEEARQLLPETVQEFTDAGFFRIVQPKRFGGFELGLDVLEEVVIEVGRGCGSSAWALAILGGHSWLAGLFNEEGQCELFGDDGHVIIATNLSGNGRATRVEGGFELSGKFVYLSGCDVANWLCVGAQVQDEGPDAPWIYAAIRPEDATICRRLVRPRHARDGQQDGAGREAVRAGAHDAGSEGRAGPGTARPLHPREPDVRLANARVPVDRDDRRRGGCSAAGGRRP